MFNEEPPTDKVDSWSLGVMLNLLLTGNFPFSLSGSDDEFIDRVRNNDPNMSYDTAWNDKSEQARDLVKSLLCKNVEERPSVSQIGKHPWLK